MEYKESKILLVGPDLPTGGVARYVKDLLGWNGKYKIVLFNTARPLKNKTKSGTGYAEVINAGFIRFLFGALITCYHMAIYPWVLLRSGARLVHICGVSYNTFWENAYYILASRLVGQHVTIHYLGAFDIFYYSAGSVEKCLIRWVLKWTHYFIALTKKTRDIVAVFLPQEILAVIPSSVVTSQFNLKLEKPSTKDGIVRVLFLGGGDPSRKGIYDLIDAAAIVRKTNNNIRFLVSGGENIRPIVDRWREKGLDTFFDWIGWIPEDQKADVYNSVDLLVLPSVNEGLPYVIIEALAAGLPVVASSIGGIPEVVRHGENGFIIDPGDSQALANYIVLLASNSELREIIGIRNRKAAYDKFSLAVTMSNLEDIFGKFTS